MLDQIKTRRLLEAKRVRKVLSKTKRRLVRLPSGVQAYTDVKETADDADEDSVVVEGEKKPRTPKFIQHCISAITQDPEKLADVKAGGEDGEGSPFAVCANSYKKKTRSKAAAHAKGDHHTVGDYKDSLKKLREAVEDRREECIDRQVVTYRPIGQEPNGLDRRSVRFSPEG
jgi:hypothetical protein